MKRFVTAAAGAMLLILSAQPAGAFELQSPDIRNGAPIATEQVYTRCGGQNVSPALVWRDAPAGTQGFAVTAIDHNASPNDWSHWILIGIPAGVTSLAKGAAPPAGAHAVMTDFGDEGYGGPCPPQGSGVHHYEFTVWALRTASVQFPPHATAKDVAVTLEKDALGKASITGTFQR